MTPPQQFNDVLPICVVCHHPIVLTWDLPKEKAKQIFEVLHDILRQKGLEPPEYYEDFFELPGETDDGQWAHEYCLTR